MLFSADAHAGLADGSITRTYRTWKRAQVRRGGRYRVAGMLLEVDAVDQVPVSAIGDHDARAAGAADVAALRRRLGEATTVWRVDLHYVGPDDRLALREGADLSGDERDRLVARLRRMDSTARHGAWTIEVLRVIGARPGVVSTELAAALGRERQPFKADVRKLKNLGLTESLAVGYQLSPRGRAVLAHIDSPRGGTRT